MASNKFYSYYLRGSQIALIEQDIDDNSRWKSPASTVADGLEIEYAYSPRYSLSHAGQVIDRNKFYVNGWTVLHVTGPDGKKRGYLTFLRNIENAFWNWDGGVSYDIDDDEYIVVNGSNRWNGLHQVQTVSFVSATALGMLVTKTEVRGESGLVSFADNTGTMDAVNIDFASDETIFVDSNFELAAHFSAGDYIWINGSATARNNGLFSISSVTQSSTAASSKLTLGTRYSIVQSDSSITYATGLDNEYSADADITAETDQTDTMVYQAHRDFCYVLSDVNVLNDESDTIDLPEYLAKALVYYVKAKMAEDQGDMERMQYNEVQFRALMNRYENSRIWGSRRIAPGIGAIR